MFRQVFKKRRSIGEKGQSSFEFLIAFVVFTFMVFFHITLSLVFMSTSFLDYTVFMSGRAATPVAARNGTDQIIGSPKYMFNAVFASYTRADSIMDASGLDIQMLWFKNVVRLSPDEGSGATSSAIISNTKFHDPEARVIQDSESRTIRVAPHFDFLFFIGSAFLPFSQNMTELKTGGISHYFRYEDTLDNCRDRHDVFVRNNWNSVTEAGVLYDNGC